MPPETNGWNAEPRITAERRLLSALCQNSLDEAARQTVLHHLQTCKFAAPDHEIVFVAWMKLRSLQPEPTREAIIASVTRMGFPDVDFDSLFSSAPPDADEVAALVRDV